MIKTVYKPKGLTSHDVIDLLRKKTGEKKIGHAGTLDPLAEGVLVVAIGRESTKKLSQIVAKEKEYIAEIKLGKNSRTDDEEGEKTFVSNQEPEKEEVERVLPQFIGNVDQVPPVYSALKIKGQPAHRRVRSGEKVEMKARRVLIKNIELLDYKYPIIEIKVTTGPGVYIRSLARDVGKTLGTGGYLHSLVRTRVGDFKIEDSERI